MCAEEIGKIASLTVITNSTRIAAVLAERGNRTTVFLLGGRFDGDNGETVGPPAIDESGRYHADHALTPEGALHAGARAPDFPIAHAPTTRDTLQIQPASSV